MSFLRNQLNSRNFSYSRQFGGTVDFEGLYTGNNVATLNITQNLSKSAERALALGLGLELAPGQAQEPGLGRAQGPQRRRSAARLALCLHR